jgi:hypothetical protein
MAFTAEAGARNKLLKNPQDVTIVNLNIFLSVFQTL